MCFFLGKQAGRKAQGQDFWWLLFPEETEIRAFFAFSVDNRYGTPRKGGLVPHTTTVNITPPGAVFQARLLDSQEGANQYSERSGLQVPSMPGSLVVELLLVPYTWQTIEIPLYVYRSIFLIARSLERGYLPVTGVR